MKREVRFQDRRIFYQVSGKGLPIVLLHGFLLTSGIWGKFLDLLAQKYLVITPDLPGHGMSDDYLPEHSMNLMAEVVLRILEKEQLQKISLIGHSMGGYVALAFREQYPQRLKALALLNSYPFADSEEKSKQRSRIITMLKQGKKSFLLKGLMEDFFPGKDQESKGLKDRMLQQALLRDEVSIIASMNGIKNRPDRSNLLKDPSLPALWILGSKDQQNPVFELMRQTKEQGLLHPVLMNTGHMSFLEDPEGIMGEICRLIH